MNPILDTRISVRPCVTLRGPHLSKILNSKSEWDQAKIIRTTTKVVQGGAEVGREQGAGGQGAGQRAGQGAGQGAAGPGEGQGAG